MAPAKKFCFPIPAVLESERVKLVPFNLAVHTKLLITSCSDVSLYDFIPIGPYKDQEEFIASFRNEKVEDNNGMAMFAVYDKTKIKEEEGYAGLVGYVNSSAQDLVTEIFVIIAPAFQRTHVTSNAIGILLKYALDLPEDGGLGLRRVVWQASAANTASIRTAERMGFQQEGVLRWHKAWPESKSRGANGTRVRKGDPREDVFPLGRDTVVLSICWDDWEGGVRAHVEATMARTK
ncbi:acyl-CoA N-acyltransferase [Desarmillaria tabescens]|uniref:Acyl-CoA N-acyltransferase n=1 Tax=Armillaria tabescens TaxID=1929756 RepID=A0AA39IYB2_ARMTA|nr:acyl-CoA N-acyltransferase [Desarmillaria tabescens]KAK0432741.1 acyl-CoA N-acyltransferase [Desarmillaria tabescens]